MGALKETDEGSFRLIARKVPQFDGGVIEFSNRKITPAFEIVPSVCFLPDGLLSQMGLPESFFVRRNALGAHMGSVASVQESVFVHLGELKVADAIANACGTRGTLVQLIATYDARTSYYVGRANGIIPDYHISRYLRGPNGGGFIKKDGRDFVFRADW